MKKIPTMFVRDRNDPSKITDECQSGCLWVFQGFGRATRKYDGTACLIECGIFYKRREVKPNKRIPSDFVEVQADEATGKLFGWVPVKDDDRWHMQALCGSAPTDHSNNAASMVDASRFADGTYELVGPKIQGNPEGFLAHTLISHVRNVDVYQDVPRVFDSLREWLASRDIEGLVFQHPDGHMAKIKKRDFGLVR